MDEVDKLETDRLDDEGADWIKLSVQARSERLSVDLALSGPEAFLQSLADELRRHDLPIPPGIERPSFRSVLRSLDALGLRLNIIPTDAASPGRE